MALKHNAFLHLGTCLTGCINTNSAHAKRKWKFFWLFQFPTYSLTHPESVLPVLYKDIASQSLSTSFISPPSPHVILSFQGQQCFNRRWRFSSPQQQMSQACITLLYFLQDSYRRLEGPGELYNSQKEQSKEHIMREQKPMREVCSCV